MKDREKDVAARDGCKEKEVTEGISICQNPLVVFRCM
jgi:hypothetical protein